MLLRAIMASSLVFKKERLFDAEFQAWVHGPVNTEIFSKYRNYGWNPIKSEKVKRGLMMTKKVY